LARLLQFCVQGFPRFGSISSAVPQQVHALAVSLENDGVIHQTSSYQRSRAPEAEVDITIQPEWTGLVEHGYISPHHPFSIAGHSWQASPDGQFILEQCPAAAAAAASAAAAAAAALASSAPASASAGAAPAASIDDSLASPILQSDTD
jgi:hypothetical protein